MVLKGILTAGVILAATVTTANAYSLLGYQPCQIKPGNGCSTAPPDMLAQMSPPNNGVKFVWVSGITLPQCQNEITELHLLFARCETW